MNRPRIYVASSWRNIDQGMTVEILRREGFEVYDFKNPEGGTGFAWSDIESDWKAWSATRFTLALDHPIAKRGFRSDMGALAEADACVLVLPCGRSAHLELGYAVGAGKFTAILMLGENEPELMYRMCNVVTDSYRDLTQALRRHFGMEG